MLLGAEDGWYSSNPHICLMIDCEEGLGACVQKVWFTLGLGFATAGLAIVPTKAACAPAMATEVPVRPLAAVAVQQLSLKSASTGNAKLAAVQPINLAGAPLPTPKLDYQIVFVLGGPGSGKGTQVRPCLQLCSCSSMLPGDILTRRACHAAVRQARGGVRAGAPQRGRPAAGAHEVRHGGRQHGGQHD